MLVLLGVIYYLLAFASAAFGMNGITEHNRLYVLVGFAAAISSAFFGAMCFVMNDIRSLLRTVVEQTAAKAALPTAAAPTAAAPSGVSSHERSDVDRRDIDTEPTSSEVASADVLQTGPSHSGIGEETIVEEPPGQDASEEELMAEYDIVERDDQFVAYDRVRFATLDAAIEYVKGTRR